MRGYAQGDEGGGHNAELAAGETLFFDYGVGRMRVANRSAAAAAGLVAVELKLAGLD